MSPLVHEGPYGPLTSEQDFAVGRREGRMLLTASAGAGKTLVLVERFVRDVIESADAPEPIRCDQILAITFTRKAAGELRARIRERFTALGEHDAAREVERSWILTIDGFCMRVLRSHAMLAGIDPEFEILPEAQARALREAAFSQALDGWLDESGAPRADALHMLAAHGYDGLQGAITEIYDSLRSAGDEQPAIPLPEPFDVQRSVKDLTNAVTTALAELRASGSSGKSIDAAAEGMADFLTAVERGAGLDLPLPRCWRPGRKAGALKTAAFDQCRDAFDAHERALQDIAGGPQLALVAELLTAYGAAFGALKDDANALDFTDLALRARRLLRDHPAVAAGYRRRLRRVMVDEFQDTNALQVSLIEALGVADVFMVGDALQSIYGFRHADVGVIDYERRHSAASGVAAALTANFRSRGAILRVINAAFAGAHEGADWADLAVPLQGGQDEREAAPAPGPAVELLVTDETAWNEDETLRGRLLSGLPPSTRPSLAAEALLVAQRVREIVDSGEATAGEIVVLVRAGGQLPLFERAIERAGLSAVAAQGRGWWARLEVLDLIAHLRVLVNPNDEEGLCAALAAFAGARHDTLALLALDRDQARRDGERYASLRDALDRAVGEQAHDGPAARVDPRQRELLERYCALLEAERAAAAWAGPGALIARVVAATGYDRATLSRPGGARRMANVRKLARLAHDFEQRGGGDLRAFVDHAADELDAKAPTSDAPVEVGADAAVRLMTIHASKGLEFPVVIAADLGHRPPTGAPRVLVEARRAGLRVTTIDRQRFDAFEYTALKNERAARDRAEERRVIHVAVTRARRRLILSGVADVAPPKGWESDGKAVAPLRWMAPLLLPGDHLKRLPEITDEVIGLGTGDATGQLRVAVNAPRTVGEVLRFPDDARDAFESYEQLTLDGTERAGRPPVLSAASAAGPRAPLFAPVTIALPEPFAAAPPTVSYSSLSDYASCGYRWYLQRVLRLPQRAAWDIEDAVAPALGARARMRGTIAHVLLERQDFDAPPPDEALIRAVAVELGAPELDDGQVADLRRLVRAFLDGPLRERVAKATRVDREASFALALVPGNTAVPMLTGSIDLLARESAGPALVIDYKTDHVEQGDDLDAAVARAYALQRAAYALAALRGGAPSVDVVHLYLERPDEPVSACYDAADAESLEVALLDACDGLISGRFPVSGAPHAGLCATCPGRGGLCSQPDELTSRASIS